MSDASEKQVTDMLRTTKIILDGTWEQKGRQPLLAAFILLFLCGTLYFFVPSLFISIYQAVDIVSASILEKDSTVRQNLSGQGYLEILKYTYEKYKYVFLIGLGLAQYLFFFGLTLVFIKKWHTHAARDYIKADRLNILPLFLASLGALLIIPLVNFISELSYKFFPIFKKLNEIITPLYTAHTPVDWILILFVYTVTPAICEETLFRGYFQRTLERKLKFPWPILLSAFLFALYHQQILSLPALFFVGIYLGFIFYSFNSFYVSMAAHGIYNLIIILLANTSYYPALLFTREGNFRLPVLLGALLLFLLLNVLIYSYSRQRALPSLTVFSSPSRENEEQR